MSLDSVDFEYPCTDLQLSGKFNISQVAINAIAASMRTFFAMSKPIDHATGYYISTADTEFSPMSMQPIYLSSDLNATFNALETSITNNMRNNDDNGIFIQR
jgi:hypothetical protein